MTPKPVDTGGVEGGGATPIEIELGDKVAALLNTVMYAVGRLVKAGYGLDQQGGSAIVALAHSVGNFGVPVPKDLVEVADEWSKAPDPHNRWHYGPATRIGLTADLPQWSFEGPSTVNAPVECIINGVECKPGSYEIDEAGGVTEKPTDSMGGGEARE